jgi:DNA-directed RNA polymerase subunit beta
MAKVNPVVEKLTHNLSNVLLGEKIPLDIWNSQTGEILILANRKITKSMLHRCAVVAVEAARMGEGGIETDPSPIQRRLCEIISSTLFDNETKVS